MTALVGAVKNTWIIGRLKFRCWLRPRRLYRCILSR